MQSLREQRPLTGPPGHAANLVEWVHRGKSVKTGAQGFSLLSPSRLAAQPVYHNPPPQPIPTVTRYWRAKIRPVDRLVAVGPWTLRSPRFWESVCDAMSYGEGTLSVRPMTDFISSRASDGAYLAERRARRHILHGQLERFGRQRCRHNHSRTPVLGP